MLKENEYSFFVNNKLALFSDWESVVTRPAC